MAKFKDLTNTKFGKLIAIHRAGYKTYGKDRPRIMWLCVCECGNQKLILGDSLRKKLTRSCGCLIGQQHGCAVNGKTPEYRVYCHAKSRCNNPNNKSYADYGGRGIKFKFDDFEDFLKEIGLRPSPQHSLDRVKVNSHYELGNIRWATRKEQNNNRRKMSCLDKFSDDDIRKEFFRRNLNRSHLQGPPA